MVYFDLNNINNAERVRSVIEAYLVIGIDTLSLDDGIMQITLLCCKGSRTRAAGSIMRSKRHKAQFLGSDNYMSVIRAS